MFLITLSLLATTYAQSVDYNQYGPQPDRAVPNYVPSKPPAVAPIDLTDEIYSRDFWSNPKAQNIIYNFEHVRQDQPPHVETREEDFGRYFNRPKMTTTTTLAPYIPEPADIHAQITNVHWYENQQAYRSRMPMTTTTTLPDWQDTYEQDQQLYSRMRSWNPEQEFQVQYSTPPSLPVRSQWAEATPAPRTQWDDSITTTRKPQTWSDPILGDKYKPDHPNPKPTRAPLIPEYSEQAVEWTTVKPRYVEKIPDEITQRPIVVPNAPVAPVWEEPKSPSAHTERLHSQKGIGNRGHQKYNWSEDVPTEAALKHSTTMAPVAPQSRGPPPPVPTLTPWYGDKF